MESLSIMTGSRPTEQRVESRSDAVRVVVDGNNYQDYNSKCINS